jgi:hypothetical protein
MQRAPWSSTARLPAALLDAARTLFVQGFADPRGCEYREIELAVGNLRTGDAGFVQTRGFVLPGERFAIAWNGLVYPVARAGAPVELAGDVAAATEIASHPIPDARRGGTGAAGPELQMVHCWRSSAGTLAERVWSALLSTGSISIRTAGSRCAGCSGCDRALTAHAEVPTSWRWRPAPAGRRAAAGRHGRGAAQTARPRWWRDVSRFSGPLPALLADEARRRARANRAAARRRAAARLPVAARVAVLIGIPTRSPRTPPAPSRRRHRHPIVDALVRISAPAIAPLIEVLASIMAGAPGDVHSGALFGRGVRRRRRGVPR